MNQILVTGRVGYLGLETDFKSVPDGNNLAYDHCDFVIKGKRL